MSSVVDAKERGKQYSKSLGISTTVSNIVGAKIAA